MQPENNKDKFLFLINPSAGPDRNAMVREKIENRMYDQGEQFKIVELEGASPMKDIIIEEIKNFKPDIAVAGGGDGTVNLIASLIRGKGVKLGIIPLGSANGMAFQLDIPDDPDAAIEKVVEGKTTKMDMLRINNEHYSLHMSDVGMNARVVKRYEKEGVRGFYGYARQYFKELGNVKKFNCTVIIEGEKTSSDIVMVILANANHYGTGAIVNPGGKIDDGLMEVILIRRFPFRFLLYLLKNIFVRSRRKDNFIEVLVCSRASISIHPPQDLQVDGEPSGKHSSIEVEVLPSEIEVITG
jgi:YegS/Rv2252/BmrU family lipid kinase